jgi:hypothetical protein
VAGMSRERQLGLFWGAAALLALAVSPFAPRVAAGLPPCFFHRVTGLPCLTCGGTRAAFALLAGDLGGAFHANPLVAAALLLFVGGGLAAGALALAGRGVREPSRLPDWVRVAVVLVVAANWIWLIVDGR